MQSKHDKISNARRYAVDAVEHLQQKALCLVEIAQINQLMHIGRKTLLDAPHHFFTWTLQVLLSADAISSAPLILLAMTEGQKLEGPFWLAVFFILYFITVGAATTIAAEFLALGNSKRHQHFYLQVRQLAHPDKTASALELEYTQDARRKKRTAIILLVALSVLLTVLGAFRVWVVNNRQWNFRIIDVLHFLPLGLAFFLVILGKYKFILIKTWQWAGKRKRLIRRYRHHRATADTLIMVMLDCLQSGNVPLDSDDLPSEVKVGIHHYRNNNPFELAELDASAEKAFAINHYN
ncbi:MAG: hypothetical protein IPH12_03180 [Saprospirales bacterium]|jgi:hypothetical protein|nr:hypothetical protein [Saprospirales bacterium]